MNDAIDGMTISVHNIITCGFKFQNATHACGHYKAIWDRPIYYGIIIER